MKSDPPRISLGENFIAMTYRPTSSSEIFALDTSFALNEDSHSVEFVDASVHSESTQC